MLLLRLATIAVLSLGLAAPTSAQEELLGIPGPLTFEETAFELAWSSHPTPEYYKQEYVPAGQAVESYAEMFMVEVLTQGQTPQSAAAAMIASLDQRKAGGDPVLQYDLISNEATGELVLDFLLSDSSSGDVIVEWNAYRYTPGTDGGLTLFAISRRGYGQEGAIQLLEALKQRRQASIQSLAVMDLPPVTMAD